MASACCENAGAPVFAEYTPTGKVEQIGDLEVYVTGSGKKAIIIIYDIFGMSDKCPQIKQTCDRLADGGFTVVAADHYRGASWSLDKFPPAPEDDLMGWLKGPKEDFRFAQVKTDVEAVRGCEGNPGVVGMCWGAYCSLKLGSDPAYGATACCHPSFMGEEKALAEACVMPVCVLPANGDPMDDVKAVMDTKPLGPKCIYQRFDDQTHGFLAARGDYSKPEVVKGHQKAVGILMKFFSDNL